MSVSATPKADDHDDDDPMSDRRRPDVTSTLAELERKLRELERELTSIGERGTEPTQTAYSTASGGRLIDEDDEPLAAGAPAGEQAPLAVRPAAEQSSRETPPPAERAPRAAHPVHERQQASAPSDAQLASLADLRRFRDRLARFANELVEDYDALLARVMASLSARTPVEAVEPAAPPASAHDEILFEGRVELGAGPFYDIASLGAFERKLAALPYVAEASVRRFEASHAVIDLHVNGPIALVRELRGALDSDFGVRQIASGRVLLTFDET